MEALFYEYNVLSLPDDSLPMARGICHQLLALGYGRRELHPGCLPARDERLKRTRHSIVKLTSCHRDATSARRELQALVDQFDAGPLTLQQLARIAVCRSIGSIHFERYVCELSSVLPPTYFKYVTQGEVDVDFQIGNAD